MAHVGDSSAYIFDDNFGEKLTNEHRGDNPIEINRFKYIIHKPGKMVGNFSITESAEFWL